MNILLINVPSRKGVSGKMLPLGLLQVGAIIENEGHSAKILDQYIFKERGAGALNRNLYDNAIRDFKPDLVGFGGIATSYGMTKELSLYIKERYPQIIQMAGGALASTYNILLKHTKVDAVIHGESEISLPLYLDRIEAGKSVNDVPGISFRSNGKVVRNRAAKQIEDLDECLLPAYHLIDVKDYLEDIENWFRVNTKQLRAHGLIRDLRKRVGHRKYFIPIISGRGCTNACLFCYRHVRGFRKHSVNYVIEQMKFIRDKYGVEGFQFCDELFSNSEEWVLQFCDAIEKNNLDIFYRVSGMRVDKVNEKILLRLKQTGCIECDFGQESGSDVILKEYKKGVTSRQNREATILARKLGLNSTVQVVIGSPSETSSTINETIQFLKDVDACQYNLNYIIPLPETPIWNHVTNKNNLIEDVEAYLDKVAEVGGLYPINITKIPDRQWANWKRQIEREVQLHYSRKTNNLILWWYYRLHLDELYKGLKMILSGDVKKAIRSMRKLLK